MEDFNAKSHKVDTCDTGLDWDFVCLIDGSPWYGSDAGLFFPRNQLNKLVITIDGINIDLETAGMYNINFKKVLRKKQFSLVKSEFGYRLYAFFSDGAGTYTVHWKIVGNKSLREVISNDERYFEWQIRKELK